MIKLEQFDLPGGDILNVSFEDISQSALVSVLLEIESVHKGTLAYVVRLMALAADGWHFTAKSSDPGHSIEVQEQLLELLKEITNDLKRHTTVYKTEL